MKKLVTIVIVLTMILSIAGCGNAVTDKNYDDGAKSESPTEFFVSPTDQYKFGETIITGEIMQFDDKYIHIISGDLVQVFEYDNTNEKQFYIGQTVSLVKGEKNNELQVSLIDDFSVKYTNMGMILTEIKGVVNEVSKEQIIVKSEGEMITIRTNKKPTVVKGNHVTAVCSDFGDGYSLVYLLNEETKLTLSVKEITRNNDGHMILSLTDADGGEYSVGMTGAVLELNLSEISIDDELVFYHEGIMESWPMQLDTILITK